MAIQQVTDEEDLAAMAAAGGKEKGESLSRERKK